MTTPTPTGTVAEGDRGPEVRITRRFAASIDDVWAAVTESDRLERWIGRWEGDPASGRLTFYMTAEGDDVEGEEFTIIDCDPPRRFAADTRVGAQTWHLRLELDAADGITTLVFSQLLGDDDMANVGPGWEYYLDRLAAVLRGDDAAVVEWSDYYPAMSEYYAALSAQ
ncbi:MAG: SRPBCC family protein [Microcella sp.]|uniref:SRPBCC family protein n=1 Tax=Microcella sp. TaxID=1913979 RepID=UPI0024C9E840|nr:SRPBCC family protein [Microcella sp.]UYN83869.1 MAG: SRPBCC family protein [Microcella sp.]